MMDEENASQDAEPGAAPPKRWANRKMAVALQYERGKGGAPSVAATGKGRIADRIIAIAKENGIPIREDADLVQLLAKLDLGDMIPTELYPVIAEVFAFIYKVNAARAATRAPLPR